MVDCPLQNVSHETFWRGTIMRAGDKGSRPLEDARSRARNFPDRKLSGKFCQ